MKCFTHREVDAVGVCRNCQRGLCGDCAHDTPHGVACRDRCELRVERIGKMYRQSESLVTWLGVFLLALGSIFVVIVGRDVYDHSVPPFALAFPGVFVAFGIVVLRTGLRAIRTDN